MSHKISGAFDQNELETSTRLMTFFTAGYVYGFVRMGDVLGKSAKPVLAGTSGARAVRFSLLGSPLRYPAQKINVQGV
jgi:hypothetical protein